LKSAGQAAARQKQFFRKKVHSKPVSSPIFIFKFQMLNLCAKGYFSLILPKIFEKV